MIVKFRVVRKDTKAAIQGAKIVLEHGETDGITNSAGDAEIITFWSGNLMFSVTATGYDKVSGTVQVPDSGSVTRGIELGAFVEAPIPPEQGEDLRGTVGTSCDLLAKWMFGRQWHSYRQRYTGVRGSWVDESDKARRAANEDPSCFLPVPPQPKTVGDLQKDVDILRGTLQGISSRIQDILTTLLEMVKAIEAVKASIPGLIASALETALAPVYAAIAALKVWIEEQIIAILLRALDKEVKEMK